MKGQLQKFIYAVTLFSAMPLLAFAQNHQYDPPWNTMPQGPVNFTVKGVDNVPDIWGDINDPQLVIFMGGNQFMVLDELIPAFKKKYPQYQRILVETLPPGLLLQQIKNGVLQIGNMRIALQPDIYTAGKKSMEENRSLFEATKPYSATRLALMIYKGNPEKITGLADLQKEDVRISMPDKKIEGIGETVEEAYRKAGGTALHQRIMAEKIADSTTFITQIHHRQSPMRILYKQSDVAPVWETEIFYQKSLGHPVDGVPIADQYNKLSTSVAGLLRTAPHKEAGRKFLDFLTSKEAQTIFKKFGFEPPPTEN